MADKNDHPKFHRGHEILLGKVESSGTAEKTANQAMVEELSHQLHIRAQRMRLRNRTQDSLFGPVEQDDEPFSRLDFLFKY